MVHFNSGIYCMMQTISDIHFCLVICYEWVVTYSLAQFQTLDRLKNLALQSNKLLKG